MSLYSSLIAQWKFNGDLLETKGNHDGTYSDGSGGESYSHGVTGDESGSYHKSVSGNEKFIFIDDDPAFRVEEITVSVWVNIDLTGPGLNIISFTETAASDGWGIARAASGHWYWQCGSGSGDADFPKVPEVLGRWVHLVGTFDGTTSKVYSDGVLYDESAKTLAYSGNPLFKIGRGAASVTGKWDNVCIFDRALTQAEINILYNDGNGVEDLTIFDDSLGEDSSPNEYGDESSRGGVWYYKQDKVGSDWVNRVDNAKGWTVDFNLRVSEISDSDWIIDENNKGKGVGLYVNDGTKQEVVNFLTQEIVFANANETKIFDATREVNYRLTGKKDNLSLYARPHGEPTFKKIKESNFIKNATANGNAINPVVFEDANGHLHVAYWDDGGNVGSIYYAKYNGSTWSDPEEIVSLDSGVQFPSVLVSSGGVVYVSFESKQTEGSVIGFVHKGSLGWSDPHNIGVDIGYCRHPKMTFDSQENVAVVWEDHRKTHQEIYLNIFLSNELKFGGEKKITTNPFGSYRPSISSYMDDLFITWTGAASDSTSSVQIMRYNALNNSFSSAVTVSATNSRADDSNVLCSVSGEVFVVWNNNPVGKYEIYSSILTPSLTFLVEETTLTDSRGGARYPVMSEQLASGSVYIVWQDYKTGDFSSFDPTLDPSDVDPYEERSRQSAEPIDSSIYIAKYNGQFISSGYGTYDVKLIFDDDRNSYTPSVPPFFSGELPIAYESYLFDEYGFLGTNDLLRRIRCSFYSLDSSSNEFLANNSTITDPSDEIFNTARDYILNKNLSTKEIRFGDFSDVLGVHYIFKDFKYYVDDAVEPYSILEIDSSVTGVGSISSVDAVINNYGDAWIVGGCGTYFYFDKQKRALKVGEQLLGIDLAVDPVEDMPSWSNTKSIAFDRYNNLFIGGHTVVEDDPTYIPTIRYSFSHVKGFYDLIGGTALPSDSTVTAMAFGVGEDDVLYVGTTKGLHAYSVTYEEDADGGNTKTTITLSDISAPTLADIFINNPNVVSSDNITALKFDDNNALWICTQSGLYRLYKNKSLRFTTVNGLPSNRINDIAIRNTAIRYVATTNGVAKMVGFNFDSFITSEDESVWNNNVKSVMWKDPNVLFAGTMSKINQVIINDVDDTYSNFIYEPSASVNTSPDDFKSYYVDRDVINEDSVIEIYINGNKIHYGFDISSDNTKIRFHMNLDNDDIVDVIVRDDISIISDFSQTLAEKNDFGANLLKIKDIAVRDLGNETANIYIIAQGVTNEIKINDSDSILPFDRIHLDTHPPRFKDPDDNDQGIKIGAQIDRSLVKISIAGATDNIFDDSDVLVSTGSGIDTMVVSNNEEFLKDDGITPLVPVPFSVSASHDLGLSLEQVVKNLNITSGTGSVVTYMSDINHLYAGVSNPAVVYKYNLALDEWEVLYTYDDDQYIDFIEKYNNNLMISVGHNDDPALVYTYTYDANDNLTSDSSSLSLFESRALSSHILNGKFYIGTGIGGGDEYASGAGTSGAIYVFDDGTVQSVAPFLTKILDGLDENVYALTSQTGSQSLLAASGPSGYIYEVDLDNKVAFIVYNSSETIVSLNNQESLGVSELNEVFAGVEVSGVIRRSIISNNTYDVSFRTVPGKVSTLKIFPVITGVVGATSYTSTFAAVGSVIYYLSESGTWVWKYTHTENINDMTFDDRSNANALFVISDTGVTKISPLSDNKVIYLKLIDRAGNESVLDVELSGDTVVVDDHPFVDSVNIAELVDFVSENKIFELDELGNTIYTLGGNSKFYSANKIDEEKGEYVSEVFDGTNDLVKWETISWQVTELFNTSVLMYVRTSSSPNDILAAKWTGPYTSAQSAGVTLSHFVGQHIQFKAVLKSSEKGITPTFHKATIRAITSESVHFFTTNFIMPTKLDKGLITSKKIVPVAADVVFGINTTNSIDWNEYQQVDEDRVFTVNQTGENLRVGIKFISPNRSTIETTDFGEYGPYDSDLDINTIPFDIVNDTGATNSYNFRVRLYSNYLLRDEVFSAYSGDSPDGFSADGLAVPSEGVVLNNGETTEVLFVVPGSANIDCETFYHARIEYIYESDFLLLSESTTFVSSCTSSFIDSIDFNFTNNENHSNDYHFRIKFYQDAERTVDFDTVFSGNDGSGWSVDNASIPEAGATLTQGDTVNVIYRPDVSKFTSGSIFYITIEAHDGTDYVFSDSSFTFQVRDVPSTDVCGEYEDVPIVENFGLMFELNNNEFITLNI